MKKGALSFLMAGVLCSVLVIAACSCGIDDPPISSTGGGNTTGTEFPEMHYVAGVIQQHLKADLEGPNSNCDECHMPAVGKIRVPTAGVWTSFFQKDSDGNGLKFTIKAGTAPDHTDVTNDDCYNTDCHVKPTS
ncbi:MAG: hypothetical protein FWD30_03115 [Dehalococcoidia bacterium]|nr:hypothetical protein [Dehalococcoidia bacterium]